MDESTAIAAFVGNKSAYYARVWQCKDGEPRPRLSVNVAAVIFGLFWLAYRKLYTPLLAVIGIMLADGLSISALEDTGMIPAVMIDAWDLIAPLVYAAVLGGFGNRWYWNKYQKTAAKARSASPDPLLQEAYLRERGGTSLFSALVLLAAAIGVVALAISAFGV
jgi:hypothetical protein